jgi:hypothetical protein
MTNERFALIDAAYEAALAGRDPEAVSIVDLLPAIFDAVPDTSPDEIVETLRWAGEKAMQEAEELRRYDNAKFGNIGKHATEGDGTLPFPEVEGKRK